MGVTLKGHIVVPPDRLDIIRDALPEHIRLTRAEPGCLHFSVTECDDTQGRFDVDEAFTDADAFAAHQARARASDWGQLTEGIERHYVTTGLSE